MQQEWKIFARNVSEMLDSSLDNMTWRALTYLLMGNLSGKPRQIPLKYSLGFYYRKPHSSEYMYVHVAAMGAFRPGMYSGAELSEWFDCAIGLEDIIRLNRLLLEWHTGLLESIHRKAINRKKWLFNLLRILRSPRNVRSWKITLVGAINEFSHSVYRLFGNY